ncbi:ubiquitin carrier protein 7 [Zea mays]|uniref:Ubiquitin carrier protein 7 n=1 Tax=Zea mays TaxID=4577 RepID=A0A1D6K760_MAIZE|nr:ubiquitin carrier protein 7 [Zea mays]
MPPSDLVTPCVAVPVMDAALLAVIVPPRRSIHARHGWCSHAMWRGEVTAGAAEVEGEGEDEGTGKRVHRGAALPLLPCFDLPPFPTVSWISRIQTTALVSLPSCLLPAYIQEGPWVIRVLGFLVLRLSLLLDLPSRSRRR